MSDTPPDDSADDIVSSHGELILYPTEDGRSRVSCRFECDNPWLSQAAKEPQVFVSGAEPFRVTLSLEHHVRSRFPTSG